MKHLLSVPPQVIPHFHEISSLPEKEWFVGADPAGRRVGSGGGTAHLLSEQWNREGRPPFDGWLSSEPRVIIHAGGKSRRLPAYAPLGKSLLPMPVFRWSRGQNLDQRVIHLQSGLFDTILSKAPSRLNTLIASGDTLIFSGKSLPEIPEADVVCFGLWIEPEKASNHGVFFARHESPRQLEFMLQKPSAQTINELIGSSYFLMDIGIWLLSPKAVKLLMQKSGWNGSEFTGGTPTEYDLYAQFGTGLGQAPAYTDPAVNSLSVALVNLEGGAFYHLGNTAELVSTNWAIQNRVNDQREIWHKTIKPHPSIFVLNADTKITWNSTHRNIWIENAHIPASWSLAQNHALTGIPANDWQLQLRSGACLDLVPPDTDRRVIRPYGFTDTFRGAWSNPATLYMEEPLIRWLEKRDLQGAFASLSPDTDIQSLPLFPVVACRNINEQFIQWLIDADPAKQPSFTRQWLKAERLSADDLSDRCDVAVTEQQRRQLAGESLPLLAKNYKHSVFYQLDLNRLADRFIDYGLPLPAELPEREGGWRPIHDRMFRAAYLRKKGLDPAEEERKAFAYLQQQVVESVREEPVTPVIDLLPDQIAWGRSPVRFDLAGGWSDTPPYGMLYGGTVLNMAAELNGQPPLHCYIKASERPEIVLRSIDLGEQVTITSFDELRSFVAIRSAFSIPKAALALAGFLPEFSSRRFTSLPQQLKALGGGLEISILAAVPKGSGLGTSSILAATVLGTLSEVCGLRWDAMETGKRALVLEQLLTTGGGWQDQYGGLLEGVKLLETTPGRLQVPSVRWLPADLFTDIRYRNRWLLYYTGITRVAKNILAEIVRGMFLNASEHLAILEEMKRHAARTAESLQQKDFEALGAQIDRSWQLNQQLDAGTNIPEIQQIIDRIRPWMTGQKLLGAGGGGFMLIVARDEEAAVRIRRELTDNPPNARGRFLDFGVSTSGFSVTRS